MKRAIVAFMVVAGMMLMMAGCGPTEEPKPKGGTTAPTAPATTPTTK